MVIGQGRAQARRSSGGASRQSQPRSGGQQQRSYAQAPRSGGQQAVQRQAQPRTYTQQPQSYAQRPPGQQGRSYAQQPQSYGQQGRSYGQQATARQGPAPRGYDSNRGYASRAPYSGYGNSYGYRGDIGRRGVRRSTRRVWIWVRVEVWIRVRLSPVLLLASVLLFRPRWSIGFGLWIGFPTAYPYYSYGYANPAYGYPLSRFGLATGTAYGGMSFEVDPYDAAIFIDGEYAGVAGDFGPNAQPLTLRSGTYRVEIQASGYEPVTFNVNVMPGQVIPYRGAMRPY